MYGEIIIGINMLFNYAILSFANKVGTIEVSKSRLILAAFIGAFPLVLFSSSWLVIICTFLAMTACAFGKKFLLWKRAVLIVLIAGVFAGGVLTLIKDRLLAQSGYKTTLVYAMIAFISLFIFKEKWLDVRLFQKQSSLTASSMLSIWGVDIPLNVFVDSGNNCTEPLSGAPVHFVSVRKVESIIPEELKVSLFSWDSKGSMTLAHFPPEYLPSIRLIKLVTVQGHSWAVGCKYDEWVLDGGESLKQGFIVFTKEDQRYPNDTDAILHISAMDLLATEGRTTYVV